MPRKGLAFVLPALAAGQAAALTIEFDYSYDGGFFSGAHADRRPYLQAAGDYVESRLGDTLLAVDSNAVGSFYPAFSDPATPGSVFTVDTPQDIAADTLRIYAGGRDLGDGVAGRGGPGLVAAESNTTDPSLYNAWVADVKTRGEAGATGNAATATDFGPWGGTVFFGTAMAWHFDATPLSVDAFSGTDFFSVAIHEIAHVLGVGTSASWLHWIGDRQPGCGGDEFCGPTAVATYHLAGNVPLEPARDTNGDGTPDVDDDAHWADGTQGVLDGELVEAAFDPVIANGQRKFYTALDWAALADVGWEVEAAALGDNPTVVPVPPAGWLLLGALGGLGLLGRHRGPRRLS